MSRPDPKFLFPVVLGAVVLWFSACTSSDAANRNLLINGEVHVYASDTPPPVYPGANFVEVLRPNDQVKVEEVKYQNSYMAVKVKLKDGRQGWVFSGESIEVK
jgi:hypothetical protein